MAGDLPPFRINRLHQVVVEELQSRILDGTYHIDEMLPSESCLAEQLNVGRRAIREALYTLQSKGLVEIKMGVGTKVVRKDLEGYLGSLLDTINHYLGQNRAELNHILEFRGVLERYILSRIIQDDMTEIIYEMKAYLDEQKEAFAAGDGKRYTEKHLRFHLTPVEGLRNPIILLVYNQLLQLTISRMVKAGSDLGVIDESIKEHELILKALEKRDNAAMERAVETHMKIAYKNFQDAAK